MSDTSQEVVRAYHARTKQRFETYAEGPGDFSALDLAVSLECLKLLKKAA